MIHSIHFDATHLDVPKAKSCTAGHFKNWWLPQYKQPMNLIGPIHVLTSLLQFLLLLLLRQNLVHSLSMQRKEKSSISFLRKYDTPNYPHQFTVIIPCSMVTGIANGTGKKQCSRYMEMPYFLEPLFQGLYKGVLELTPIGMVNILLCPYIQ